MRAAGWFVVGMVNTIPSIEEKQLEPFVVAGIRIRGKYSDCGPVFGKLGKLVGRHIRGKGMNLYHDETYQEEDADFEPCFPISGMMEVEGVHVQELPACRCLSLLHHGPYDSLHESYALLFSYAQDKGLKVIRPTREIYIKGPGMFLKGNPKKYVTEIQLPVEG